MDITRIGGLSWNETKSSSSFKALGINTGDEDDLISQQLSVTSQLPTSPHQSAVKGFLQEISSSRQMANSVGDLLSVSRNRLGRQFVLSKVLQQSSSVPILNTTNDVNKKTLRSTKKGKTNNKSLPGGSYSITERPPNREEIKALEYELEERVRNVLYPEEAMLEAVYNNNMFQPHKDATSIMRKRVLKDINILEDEVNDTEPWLDRLVKCECLHITCDTVTKKLIDMIAVSSTELGNVLRKLRYTQSQTFDEVKNSWQTLRDAYLNSQKDLNINCATLNSLKFDLDEKEDAVKLRVEHEVNLVKAEYEKILQRDREILNQSELKVEQLSDTLTSLNGIFKAMQTGSNNIKTADIMSKCQRLEKENNELSDRCMKLENASSELKVLQDKCKSLEMDLRLKDAELNNARQSLLRREEVVASLMEKEALRDAEIEQLQKQIYAYENPTDVLDFHEPATSVLCIKCKKSLDDLSNIRAAVLGNAEGNKIKCESFRILLPNLKGRRPNRDTNWTRLCMRSILISKMKEDVSLLGFKADSSRFPQYTYAWFEKRTSHLSGSALQTAYAQADEDRWGFYYSIKALCKDDPESMLFWALLDESFGEDGLQFICHCLSVVMSISGPELWKQFGNNVLSKGNNINCLNLSSDNIKVCKNIWLDVKTAVEAVKMILSRALKPHLVEAIDAIDALRAMPDNLDIIEGIEGEVDEGNIKPAENISNESKAEESVVEKQKRLVDATHIDIFMWLRIMLQIFQAEQIHRGAAIRLMFEAASVGALTPKLPSSTLDKDNLGAIGSQVEFPQFMSIVKTIFPLASTTDVAVMYGMCYEVGKKKVTADVFIKVSDRNGLFSRSMRLHTLPLLQQHDPTYVEVAIENSVKVNNDDDNDDEEEEEEDLDKKENENDLQLKNKEFIIPPTPIEQMVNESVIRVHLGSLIHRKITALKPEVLKIMQSVPERWKSIIANCMEDVNVSLNDSYQAMKKKFSNIDEKDMLAHHYIDGVQPYIHYRRLLSVILMIKSVTDNPLLPSEIFIDKNRRILPNSNIGVKHAEKILSSLEECIIPHSVTASTNNVKVKIHSFEQARKVLVVRRLQNFIRSRIYAPSIVPISMRRHMRPGYLRYCHDYSIKKRKVLHLPWWAETCIAEILHFKVEYDRKACQLGLNNIPLAEAIYSTFYVRWGNIDIAERYIQDLFYCLREYEMNSPRMRLFLGFFGQASFNPDIDDQEFVEALQSPQAIALYVNLIHLIHREIELSKYNYDVEKRDKSKLSEVKAAGILIDDNIVNESNNSTKSKSKDAGTSSRLSIVGSSSSMAKRDSTKKDQIIIESKQACENNSQIDTFDFSSIVVENLFPSSESAFTRSDRRSVWSVEPTICRNAVKSWTKLFQRSLEFEEGGQDSNVFVDLIDTLKLNLKSQVDVDELLYLVILQWAKFASFYVKRSVTRADLHEKSCPQFKAKLSFINQLENSMPVEKPLYAPMTYLSINNMQNFVESIYRPSEGNKLVDISKAANLYLNTIVRKGLGSHLKVNSYNGTEKDKEDLLKSDTSVSLKKLLKDTTLWDTNIVSSGSNAAFIVPTYQSSTSFIQILSIYKEIYESLKDSIVVLIKSIENDPSKHNSETDKHVTSCNKLLHQIDQLVQSENSNTSVSIITQVIQLISSVTSLSTITLNEFPKDMWKAGYKLTGDVCVVYNLLLKKSPY